MTKCKALLLQTQTDLATAKTEIQAAQDGGKDESMKLNLEIEAMKADMDKLRNDLKASEKKNKDLVEFLNSMTTTNNDLNNKLKIQIELVNKLKESSAQLQASLDENRNQGEDEKNNLQNEMNLLKEQGEMKISDLEAALDRLRKKIEDVQADLGNEKLVSSDFKHQNETLQAQIEALNYTIGSLNEKLKAAEVIQKKLDQMIIDDAVNKKEAEFMKYQIESKKERIAELQEALKNLQKHLKEEQDKARAAFEENMNTVETLKSELSAKIEAEKTLIFQIEKLNNDNSDLKTNLKIKTEEFSDLSEKYSSAEAKFKLEIETATIKNQVLTDENKRLEGDFGNMKEQLQSLKDQLQAVKEELDESEENCQKLELKIQYEEEKNQHLTDENGNLKIENKKNQEKILDLTEENRKLNDEVERLKMQIQNLTSALSKLEAENLRLKDDIDAKNSTIENIRKDLDEVQKEKYQTALALQNEQERCKTLQASNDSFKEKNANLEEKLKTEEDKNIELRHNMEKLKYESDLRIQKLESGLEIKTIAVDDLNHELLTANKTITNLTKAGFQNILNAI